MKNLSQLYAEYGQLMVQSEIMGSKINAVKQQIKEVLKQSQVKDFKEVVVPKKEDKVPEKVSKPKKMTAPKKSKKTKKKK